MSKNVSDIVVETLKSAGAKHWYGIPGDTLNYVTDAVRRNHIRWVHVRHEEAGAFAAGAEALFSNTLTICAGSCGPGSLHFINGLFESHRNRAPVVLIASQITLDDQSPDFPQYVDLKEIYKHCSVYCDQISSPEQAQYKTVLAAQAALSKRGVAVLILPSDIAKQAASSAHPHNFSVHQAHPVIHPNPQELSHIVALINQGQKITIYGGSGCEHAHDALVALGKRLKAPIAHASRAKDFLEYDNPHDLGMIGIFGTDAGCYAVAECDTLIVLGSDFAWKQYYPESATIIQIDIDATHLGRRHPITFGAVGDIAATLDVLLPMLPQKTDHAFLGECLARYKHSKEMLDKHAHATKSGMIRPQYLTHVIDELAAPDAMFTADGGSPMVWMLRHISVNGTRRTLGSLLHGTMANAMPQALGLKVAFPDRQVISLSGDGGLSMLLGDLLTAVQENIPVKIVVYNNSSLFFVEMEQRVEGLLDAFTHLNNPDFAALAKTIGFWSRRVEHTQDLENAVTEWLQHSGPALLDVVVDRELVVPPSINAKAVKGLALYATKAVLGGHTQDLLTMIKENLAK